ncbi:carbohydrate ABC transporter ATP-binding protein, CUT1 family [Tistlia consotensis]|uniref:Carbohydrate ABC transporter ATP-binding protein, CUT1 family n=1 Tax=Tistlia consotensis USBA 355 TaxID=560819 RepID=A0A1Y6B6A3_9PROT|nr:sn-glycerol-3-phosphate import ATP-binding protein UgpC [Tistlia consotensis]SME94371.1 carbohydrate ABC transporter ATP-binding protein, CUT1 family [Tistlia consotensis USBA 355]SNR29304.1 carbohydrate ABC transporter ATP-binding protein, CUT1 family [Tistlia consotensis]
MAEICMRGVRKRYGDTQVIHGIDVEIADGEFIVIVGPSGCGKSTLLRMVAGLETITEGEISIGGRVVNQLEPKERDIAMVFQNYALYPHMSVFDNMAYGLKIARTPKDEIRARVEEAAKLLELGGLLERKPRQLSGGQRQRVAMGRAIVRKPAVFLFDEPLSNLDAKLRVQMRLEIKQLQRKLGTTSLYVTHDQIEAMTLADRLVVMNQGRAEQIDTPMAVYSDPATTFVAGFIGSPAMNFLAGTVEADGHGLFLGGDARISDKGSDLSGLAGRAVTLGVRPEHLLAVGESEAEIRLGVELVETLGADTLAHGRPVGAAGTPLGDAALGGEAPGLITVRLPGLAPVREGERLPLRMAEGELHLFDPDSGRRIADV